MVRDRFSFDRKNNRMCVLLHISDELCRGTAEVSFFKPQEPGEREQRGVAGARVHLQDVPAILPNSPLAAPGAALPRSRRELIRRASAFSVGLNQSPGAFSRIRRSACLADQREGSPKHQHLSLSSASQGSSSTQPTNTAGDGPWHLLFRRAWRGSL